MKISRSIGNPLSLAYPVAWGPELVASTALSQELPSLYLLTEKTALLIGSVVQNQPVDASLLPVDAKI